MEPNLLDIIEALFWISLFAYMLYALRTRDFPERKWLQIFAGILLAQVCVGFLTPILAMAAELREATSLASKYLYPMLTIAAYACLLRFVLKYRFSPQFSGLADQANELIECSDGRRYLPRTWLLVLAVALTLICIVHSINGSILATIVSSFHSTDIAGSGAAMDFARELELRSKIANAAGSLYFATGLSWLTWAALVGLAFLRTRSRSKGAI